MATIPTIAAVPSNNRGNHRTAASEAAQAATFTAALSTDPAQPAAVQTAAASAAATLMPTPAPVTVAAPTVGGISTVGIIGLVLCAGAIFLVWKLWRKKHPAK